MKTPATTEIDEDSSQEVEEQPTTPGPFHNMKSVQFVFGLHNHQPVGNFESVFEEAYQKSYLPFLELLERFPAVRTVLHHTGPLLNWLAERRGEYLDRLGKLVDRDQVELLGGAFYEPILPVIPQADRVGQIVAMSDWLEKRFGRRPRGMWLAERVWEPTLPSTMMRAGIEYTILDDSHFKGVGIGDEGTMGYYLTEDEGLSVAVFPINEFMRYAVPFRPVEEAMAYLHELANDQVARTIVMADDGEKFGVWPDTYKHCYTDGWLERFFELIERNTHWLQMKTFSEVLDETSPIGRVYLPAASYVEMMEWAMPPRAILAYNEFVSSIKARGEYDERKIFIRGGFWRQFFAKYDEANHMHKKMLHVSAKLTSASDEVRAHKDFAVAQDHLWQAQCNCAYWHGVFGGLYLANLRNALYEHLIAAETIVDDLNHKGAGASWVEFLAKDFEIDGGTDLLVETPAHAMMVKPHVGGMMVEHDIRALQFNLLNTLMRRREYYHEKIWRLSNPAGPNAREDASIRVKEGNLDKLLVFDWYRRGSLIDHFLDYDASPDNFRQARYPELGDFVNQPFSLAWKRAKGGARVEMARDGMVLSGESPLPVRLEKTIEMRADRAAMTVSYRITNLSDMKLHTRFGVEFNVNLLGGHTSDRIHRIEGAVLANDNNMMDSVGTVKNAQKFSVTDEWLGLRVDWALSRPAEHWRLPIETVSSSEAGFERVYQSTVVMPVWDLALEPNKPAELKIEYSASTFKGARG